MLSSFMDVTDRVSMERPSLSIIISLLSSLIDVIDSVFMETSDLSSSESIVFDVPSILVLKYIPYLAYWYLILFMMSYNSLWFLYCNEVDMSSPCELVLSRFVCSALNILSWRLTLPWVNSDSDFGFEFEYILALAPAPLFFGAFIVTMVLYGNFYY